MTQRLKRWESPRNEGRNDKGRGGSARQRQKKKQLKALRNRLKSNGSDSSPQRSSNSSSQPQKREETSSLPVFVESSVAAF